MNELPVILSVPHAGTLVPEEVRERFLLDANQIVRDGDEGAAEIYALEEHVRFIERAEVARAVCDMNRAPTDIRRDGVVKTHSCWDEEIYDRPLEAELVKVLIERYHQPYHAALAEHGKDPAVRLGIDGHTMAAFGPPEAADEGRERPFLCLSDGAGTTCPRPLLLSFADQLEQAFGKRPSINEPFQGGYITRHHAGTVPWIQVEFSRAPYLPNEEKRARFLEALRALSLEQGW